MNKTRKNQGSSSMEELHKTRQKEGIRRKEPFSLRPSPKLWPLITLLLLLFGAIVFGLVCQNCSCSTCTSVVVVGGLLVVLAAVVTMVAVVGAAAFVMWITVMVLLSLIGRSRRRLVVEGRKISREIMVGFVVKVLLKEVNVLLGAISSAAVLGYLLAFVWGPLLFLSTPNYFG